MKHSKYMLYAAIACFLGTFGSTVGIYKDNYIHIFLGGFVFILGIGYTILFNLKNSERNFYE